MKLQSRTSTRRSRCPQRSSTSLREGFGLHEVEVPHHRSTVLEWVKTDEALRGRKVDPVRGSPHGHCRVLVGSAPLYPSLLPKQGPDSAVENLHSPTFSFAGRWSMT